MIYKNEIFVLVVMILFTGCAGPEITNEGSNVKVMKSDPPRSCKELGIVDSTGVYDCNLHPNECRISIRNNAGKIGANYLRLDTASDEKIVGTAYKCK